MHNPLLIGITSQEMGDTLGRVIDLSLSILEPDPVVTAQEVDLSVSILEPAPVVTAQEVDLSASILETGDT